MKAVSIHDAKSNLSKYIADAKNGKKVYIGSFHKPEVMLVKIPPAQLQKKRDFSSLRGKIAEHPDSFSPSTDANISSLLYGE